MRRVLIVDDEPAIGRTLKRALAGDDVDHVTRAAEALSRIVAGERFDVILCDLGMPEMDGIELFDALVRLAPEQARRMAFMTGGAGDGDVSCPMLRKPFDSGELRAMVTRLSGEPPVNAGAEPPLHRRCSLSATSSAARSRVSPISRGS